MLTRKPWCPSAISPLFLVISITEIGATVLVVDDIARNLRLLGSMLTEKHYEVLFASSGEKALERVAARKPDLILLDLMMPGMDGLELSRRLKADPEFMEIPIIFVTAAGETGIATQAMEAGAVDFVTKPFNKDELLARVRVHVRLKRSSDELYRIIAQKNELLSVIAHDLKNPIAAMRYGAFMLRDQGVTGDDPRGELVDSICETADRTLEFIDDQLTRNSRSLEMEQFQIEPVEPMSVVVPVIQENLMNAHRKKITLDLEIDDSMPDILADQNALVRVLKNMVSNAIKFSSSNRTVLLEVAEGSKADCLRFSVRDQGPGLSREDQELLFRPYQRLSARPTSGESSTGLGLSISRDLVEKMNGVIGCDSVLGEGSTFWVELKIC